MPRAFAAFSQSTTRLTDFRRQRATRSEATGGKRRVLSSNRHARGRAQGVPEARGVHVVENLPREDGGLPGNIEDWFRPRRRKPIGFIRCCWIGIGIAVGCQPPSGILFQAWRTQGRLERVSGPRGGGRSLHERWRVTRPFAGDRKCSVGAADGDNRDRSQHSGGHAISHVSAISLAHHIGRCLHKQPIAMDIPIGTR
jgi:hypothetical protein